MRYYALTYFTLSTLRSRWRAIQETLMNRTTRKSTPRTLASLMLIMATCLGFSVPSHADVVSTSALVQQSELDLSLIHI